MKVAGVDGTKGGWVAVVLDDGRLVEDQVLSPVKADFSELMNAAVIAVDVPIGFGPRRADAAARAFMRGAASTVFTTPSRKILESRFGPGLGVSAQAHALGERILHVTKLAGSDPAGGVLERIEILRRHAVELDHLANAAVVPIDDVLDAAAAAWSAHRIATGVAQSLPEPPEVVNGHLVAIWY